MFERLVKRPFHLARYRNGPHAEERNLFLAHLVQEGRGWHRLKAINWLLLEVAMALRSLKLNPPCKIRWFRSVHSAQLLITKDLSQITATQGRRHGGRSLVAGGPQVGSLSVFGLVPPKRSRIVTTLVFGKHA